MSATQMKGMTTGRHAPGRGSARAALAAGLLLLACALPEALAAQGNPLRGTIRGRALDDLNEAGLREAKLEFLDDLRRVRRTTLTDSAGYFLLADLPPGPFRLRVTQMGYLRTTTPTWWVEAGEVLDVVVRMRPDAVPLAPLEVIALSRMSLPVLSGFYRRSESAVSGTFLDREDIEAKKASRVTDLLADLPGVRLERASGYAGQAQAITLGRAMFSSRGGRCPVQVYVDGVLATRGGEAVPLDDLAYPNDLEGVEVYRGLGSVPAEFLTPEARCGVIALWTRRGQGSG